MKQPESYQKLLGTHEDGFLKYAQEKEEKEAEVSLYRCEKLQSDALNYIKENLGEDFEHKEKLSKQLAYDYLVFQKHSLKTYYFNGKNWEKDAKDQKTNFILDELQNPEEKDKKKWKWEGKGHGIKEISQIPEGGEEEILLCAKASSVTVDGKAFYKKYHLNCYSAWTEEWESLEDKNFKFHFFKNLNAEYMIFLKDSTSMSTHYPMVEDKAKKNNSDDIQRFINKEELDEALVQEYFKDDDLKTSRNGRDSQGGKTNDKLKESVKKYLGFDIINEKKENVPNPSLYLGNTFIFLSARGHSSSKVPEKGFDYSVLHFNKPLISIVKPKVVILGGKEACRYIGKQGFGFPNFSGGLTNFIEETHKLMEEVNKLDKYTFSWNDKKTLFLPTYHPAAYGQYDQTLVWSQIKKLKELYFNEE